MTSDEGLNAYGAATWGQFFIYQGFNEHLGWMHTSTGADAVDEFAETIVRRRTASSFYRYGDGAAAGDGRRRSRCPIATADGSHGDAAPSPSIATHHGPIVREADGKWIAMAMMNKPVEALEQSFLRTKAARLRRLHEGRGAEGQFAPTTPCSPTTRARSPSCMPQFDPRRDDRFDYTKPVDGADPATDWQGLHAAGRHCRTC